MSSASEKREQVMGWTLAGLMALHFLAARLPTLVGLAAWAILAMGAILRGRQIHAPWWLGSILLLLSFVAVGLTQELTDIASTLSALLGELGAMVGAILLLRPVTPWRCQRILFCLLLVLIGTILGSTTGVGQTLIVFDVAVMYLVLEESFRPPEVRIGFWVSVARSFRVIVPVGLVVMSLFWIFPNLSAFSSTNTSTFTGFSGSDTLDARSIAELSQSYRVAFTAYFGQDQAAPSPDDLYWRGQVMENNDGFRWSVANARIPRQRKLPDAAPSPSATAIPYSEEIAENRGIVPALDHAIFIKPKSDGQDLAIIDQGAGSFSVGNTGSLTLAIISSNQNLSDAPTTAIQEGFRQVPLAIRQSGPIQKIVARVLAPETDTPGKLRALARYFQDSGFRYTMRPGRIQDMTKFLTEQRAGFCGHYATVAANLLRLAQVPTRVVSGYRGGEWDPWRHSITVRDADAHAWVEAWDEPSHRWLRFDPTDSVAPEIRVGIEREMDSSKWAWYRRDWGFGRFLATETSTSIGRTWDRLMASEYWARAQLGFFLALVGVTFFWLIRNLRGRHTGGPQEKIASLLLDLEQRAARQQRGRSPGETPLAWLDRLVLGAGTAEEKETVRDLARSYEDSMYKPGTPNAEMAGNLRQDVQKLVRLWRSQPGDRRPGFR